MVNRSPFSSNHGCRDIGRPITTAARPYRFQRRVSSLVDKLYQGEPGLLVLHLLKSHPLDATQAMEVRDVLDQMSAGKSKKKNG